MARIYGKVEGPEDIRRINCIIRDEMLVVEDKAQLTDLKKRSDYLCTLTYSPFWKKKFGSRVEQLRQVAREENFVTVRLANLIAKFNNWDAEYDPWGPDDPSIEEQLKNLPEEVIKETLESTIDLKEEIDILEDYRRSFCNIRKAMVMVESQRDLVRLKRSSDLLVAMLLLPDFQERFADVFDRLKELVEKEEERTVKLADIVATVNGWKVTFEKWDASEIAEDQTIEQYIEKLMEEEEKAEKYIPTEYKYKEGRTLWLVYFHSRRNRWFAKRIYFPGSARNIQLEGPGEFTNRFGRKVWGVKITYEALLRPTTIRRGNVVIRLPERWVKRTKVVELPKAAEKIELKEERPDFAYPVA
ncbi:MAG: hypothetical protein GXO48_03660 [Chlorobi bacterium]|nr:hypothetical protein [Chlorobiota bacterium]